MDDYRNASGDLGDPGPPGIEAPRRTEMPSGMNRAERRAFAKQERAKNKAQNPGSSKGKNSGNSGHGRVSQAQIEAIKKEIRQEIMEGVAKAQGQVFAGIMAKIEENSVHITTLTQIMMEKGYLTVSEFNQHFEIAGKYRALARHVSTFYQGDVVPTVPVVVKEIVSFMRSNAMVFDERAFKIIDVSPVPGGEDIASLVKKTLTGEIKDVVDPNTTGSAAPIGNVQ